MTEMTEEVREGMIVSLSVFLFKDTQYFEKMSDREVCDAYDRMMKMNEG